MKRELFDNVMVIANASGAVIDREGFLSAVFAADVGAFTGEPTGATLSIKVEHCDTDSGSGYQAGPRAYLAEWHPPVHYSCRWGCGSGKHRSSGM